MSLRGAPEMQVLQHHFFQTSDPQADRWMVQAPESLGQHLGFICQPGGGFVRQLFPRTQHTHLHQEALSSRPDTLYLYKVPEMDVHEKDP
jgi:hypothetical protein